MDKKLFENQGKKIFSETSKESLDILEKRIEKLKDIFPSVVSDGKIDFSMLKQVLGKNITEKEDRYRFTWNQKNKAILEPIIKTTKTLRPESPKELLKNTENLYIEGENLEALKILQESYAGEIKMIYIDPPYNTGNDFIYNDKFANSDEEAQQKEGLKDKNNKRIETLDNFKKNSKDSAKYHTNWLNMMYPRLSLARDLLTDDGVIFISIDDNEVHNLRKICDEIFGENNFVSLIGLEITKTQGMKVKSAKEGGIVKNYEFILCYIKQKDNKKIVKELLYDKNSSYDKHFSYYIDKENEKAYKLIDILNKNLIIKKEFLKYKLVNLKNEITMKDLIKGIEISAYIKNYIYNKISDKIYQEMACNINIIEIKDKIKEGKVFKYKEYLLTKSSGGKIRQFSSLKDTLKINDEYNSEYSRVTIRGNLWKNFYSDMMNVAKEGNIDFNNGKKPVRLIKQLIKWITSRDALILDFFSGSATTAHAVMQLNAEDGGNRKYIMVQLPEETDEKSEAFKAGHKNICEIGKARIRKAAEKIKKDIEEKNKQLKLGEEPKEIPDLDFKTFKIDSTNFKEWEGSMEEIKNSIKDGAADIYTTYKKCRSEIDIISEVIIKEGYKLTDKIEIIEIDSEKIYKIADGLLYIFLKTLNNNIINKIIELYRKNKEELYIDNPKLILNETYMTTEIKSNIKKTLESEGIVDIKTL